MRNLLKYQKKKFYKDKNSEFLKFDISSQKIKKKYDWVVLSGTFNDKHKGSQADMLKILTKNV